MISQQMDIHSPSNVFEIEAPTFENALVVYIQTNDAQSFNYKTIIIPYR